MIKSLGFLVFKCLNGQSNSGDSISSNSSITNPANSINSGTNSPVEKQIQLQTDSSTPVGAIVAGILVPIFIIAGALVSLLIYRRRIG